MNAEVDLNNKEYMKERAETAMMIAARLLELNYPTEARAFVSLAARIDFNVVQIFSYGSNIKLRILAANEVVLHTRRGKEIGRPCAILGSAGPTLEPGKEAFIRSIFDQHQDGFAQFRVALPQFSGLYGNYADAEPNEGRPIKVLLILARYINAHPGFMESDIFHHFKNSPAQVGLSTHVFEADALLYDMPARYPFKEEEIAEARRKLDEALALFQPDVIVFEGNFFPTDRTVNPSWLHAARQRYGSKIVAIVADCYDAAQDVYGAWAEASDRLVIFNRETTYTHTSGHRGKAFVAASVPFDETAFAVSDGDKNTDMVIVGHNSRERGDLLAMLQAYEVPISPYLHSRLSDNAPDLQEYGKLLRESRLTYNTGRIHGTSSFSVLTGRCFESILSKTVLLEEVGSGITDYFLPFVHYVPYANCTQLVMFSQFLLKNDDYRRRIADQAYAWHRQRYTPRHFWGALLKSLGLPSGLPKTGARAGVAVLAEVGAG